MSDNIDSIDKFVGNKIKERRKTLKLSQSKLAELMSLSYQQIQKYESGSNKVTIKRLIHLSKALNVPTSYFYEGVQIDDDEFGESLVNDVIKTGRTNPLNVLLVEDDAGDEILIRNIIEDCAEEVNVHSIRDSDTVMEFLFNHKSKYAKPRPDIVFLDLMLPKTDGISLLKEIKKNRSVADIPVIILSNSIETDKMLDAYNNNASGFVTKSVDFEELSESISSAIHYWGNTVVLPNM